MVKRSKTRSGKSLAVVPVREQPTGLVPAGRTLAGTGTTPLELFKVPERHPDGEGPWRGEPDKMSWVDPSTDLPCILLRGANGTLGGYVGVGPAHPLFGVSVGALPHDPPIVVHGGITYAAACQERAPREISICHIPAALPVTRHTQEPLGSTRGTPPEPGPVEAPDDLWWFGFRTNHRYDVIPSLQKRNVTERAEGLAYRDEAYVVRETTNLAAQLHAIDRGLPLPDAVGERPPIGLESLQWQKR